LNERNMSMRVSRSLARLRSDRSRCKQPQDFIQAISTYIKLQILAVQWQLCPPHHFSIIVDIAQILVIHMHLLSSSTAGAPVMLGNHWKHEW